MSQKGTMGFGIRLLGGLIITFALPFLILNMYTSLAYALFSSGTAILAIGGLAQ